MGTDAGDGRKSWDLGGTAGRARMRADGSRWKREQSIGCRAAMRARMGTGYAFPRTSRPSPRYLDPPLENQACSSIPGMRCLSPCRSSGTQSPGARWERRRPARLAAICRSLGRVDRRLPARRRSPRCGQYAKVALLGQLRKCKQMLDSGFSIALQCAQRDDVLLGFTLSGDAGLTRQGGLARTAPQPSVPQCTGEERHCHETRNETAAGKKAAGAHSHGCTTARGSLLGPSDSP